MTRITRGDSKGNNYFHAPQNRKQEVPLQQLKDFHATLQTSAYPRFNPLFAKDREGGPARNAGCLCHGRRKFIELPNGEYQKSLRNKYSRVNPYDACAQEAVDRIDDILEVEEKINGEKPEIRLATRLEESAPMMADLKEWLEKQLAMQQHRNVLTKSIDYMLSRWHVFDAFLDDGRLCPTNNAAERQVRPVAQGRHSYLFFGNLETGGEAAARLNTLINTCRLNNKDPLVRLTDFLTGINEIPESELPTLLPWNWKPGKSFYERIGITDDA